MQHPSTRCLLLTLALAASLTKLCAQSASVSVPTAPAAPAPKPAAPLSTTEQWIADAKKPAAWLSWGADLRVRDEYYNNIVSLSDVDPLHEQNVIRYRSRFWASATPVTNVSFNARIASESRLWTKPSFIPVYGGRTGMEWRYGIVDNMNLKWANAFDQPLTITAGRQDIVLGDFWNWWLVADGTPGDGSWSYFLDSARLTYDAKDLKTRFDGIFIYQRARPDDWMPTLDNSSAYGLTEQNEQGVILYASNKSLKNTQIDGYFIYKGDDQEFRNGDDANIFTLGAKITGTPAEHWSYSLEGAYQFGEKMDPMVRTPVPANTERRDLDAFGVNARVSYLFKDVLNNQAHLIFEHLSGDDPDSTGRDEMFDVLWGRWPRWSELYIYSYVQETGGKIAQLNNIQRIGAGWTLNPMKPMQLGFYYNALFAPESVPTRTINAARFSQDGHFRGHYFQGVLTHTFSRHVKGHLWSEFIWQDDFYVDRELLTFLRAEVSLTF